MKTKRSLDSYRREVRKLRDLIVDIQWVQQTNNSSESCTGCGWQRHMGCCASCPVAKVTGDFGKPQATQEKTDA